MRYLLPQRLNNQTGFAQRAGDLLQCKPVKEYALAKFAELHSKLNLSAG